MFYQESPLELYQYFNELNSSEEKPQLISGGFPIKNLIKNPHKQAVGGGDIGELSRFDNLVIPVGLVLENYGGRLSTEKELKDPQVVSDDKMADLFELITINNKKDNGGNKTRKVLQIKTFNE